MSQLIVYSASAGSGKTYRLAVEYIKQVLENPESFRNILAVTFTNKATNEMKQRILSELFNLANGDQTSIFKNITKETTIPEDQITKKAQKALSLILHDYSLFSISTIDSFVQRVIQSLLWEIGEQGGVDIELDTGPVLELAADNLLDSASQTKELLSWISQMGYSLMDEGKSWDVRGKLIELGNQLFSEKFRLMNREEVEKFTDRKNVNQLKESLQELLSTIVKEINEPAAFACKELEKRGLTVELFSYKERGVIGFFNNCNQFDSTWKELPKINSYTDKALEDPTGENWVNKGIFKDKSIFPAIESIVNDVLHSKLVLINNVLKKHRAYYLSAILILKNLENLALIGDLWNKIRELSREEGFLLLSDSGHLLRELVKDFDAPFVYEKVGTRYDMYMIDEFQDTSEVQWHNFKPLIENSLSQDYFSMIVGDVKQSIYRWRNGNWSILANQVEKDFYNHGVNRIPLTKNWRSLPQVVNFNNTFFENAKQAAVDHITGALKDSLPEIISEFSQQIKKAYADTQQTSIKDSDKGEGYVEVNFFEKGNNIECDKILAEEIVGQIKELRKNYSLSQIGILIRTKSDGQRIANMLLEHNKAAENAEDEIAFVSQEGLKLKASHVVRFVVSALSLVQDSKNEIEKRVFAKELAIVSQIQNADWHSYFSQEFTSDEVNWLSSLNTRPLQEVFEAIVQKYNLQSIKGELAYLAELHEHMATITSKGGGDVNRFLTWWQEKNEKLSLTVPETTNALSITTIHKSKGLEFPVVIIPYANWMFRQSGKQPTLWVSSPIEPFDILPKYPIQASKTALQSLFARDVAEEEMKELVDNMNLLYVGFTRAKKELYIYAPLSKKEMENADDGLNSVSKLIRNIVMDMDMELSSDDAENRIEKYHIGKKENEQLITSSSSNQNLWLVNSYPVGQSLSSIKLKMESEGFFNDTINPLLEPLIHGKAMHDIFANITTVKDIEQAVHNAKVQGLIPEDQRDATEKLIRERLSKTPFS
ncbi:MAG TPA: hypothetical protein DG754_07140, partial [Bacteroidales bacterium]|nr:hypothetical protein [Bacteroidales bacterium]